MMENNQKSTESSKEDLENKVMQVLMELYEHQTGAKYAWEKVGEKERSA